MKRGNRGSTLIILAIVMFVLVNIIISIQNGSIVMLKDKKISFPVEIIGGNSGVNIRQDKKTYTTPSGDKNNKEFVIQGVYLGQSEKELVFCLGEPSRKDLSEYGFDWYVYNEDYGRYIQVGVKDSVVVGIYTNAGNWKSTKGINIGMARTDTEKLLGKSLRKIKKNSGIYLISNRDEKGVYFIDNSYVTIFYDIHNKNTVTALQIIDKNTELLLDGYFGDYSKELRDGFERQAFDLANSIRVRNNLEPFIWSKGAQISSRKHSQDMADNNFFEHINLKREGPSDRMEKAGIVYTLAAENIAAGAGSSIEAHEGWMNSQGHRVNILGECRFLGVGVAYNSDSEYKYYYTQNFYTGR